jgi:hypothetical protein
MPIRKAVILRGLVTVEGPAMILTDLDARMADPGRPRRHPQRGQSSGSVPELIGFGPDLLATAILPAAG